MNLKSNLSESSADVLMDLLKRFHDIYEDIKEKQGGSNKVFAYKQGNILKDYEIYLKTTNKAKSTIKEYIQESGKLLVFLNKKGLEINTLAVKNIELYLSEQKNSRNIGDNSYYKLVNVIRSFLKFLYKKDYIGFNIAEKLTIDKRPEQVSEYLTDQDINKIEQYLENIKGKDKLRGKIIIYLGIDEGLRRQEFINLNWEDIDLDNKKMKIIKSKGGKSRQIEISSRLNDLLIVNRKEQKKYKGPVIRGDYGKRISKSSLQNIVSEIFKASDVYRDGLCIHSLRHTCAVRLLKKGYDSSKIQKFLGHSRLDTTEKYLHATTEGVVL